MKFKIGDSVKIKQGILDADYNKWDISGWQGWITVEANEESIYYELVWDTETLKNMPIDYILQGNKSGVEWECYRTDIEELESATPRDTFKKAQEFADKFRDKHAHNDGSPTGEIIATVIDGDEDIYEALDKWKDYLSKNLKFPFNAVVSNSERGALRDGQKIVVQRIYDKHFEGADMYGLLVNVSHNGQKYQLPMCNLDVEDEMSDNYTTVEAYSEWFVNF